MWTYDFVMQKHPHVRGEDEIGLPLMVTKPETPPRAWGRQRFDDYMTRPHRNTPTCVGKTA